MHLQLIEKQNKTRKPKDPKGTQPRIFPPSAPPFFSGDLFFFFSPLHSWTKAVHYVLILPTEDVGPEMHPVRCLVTPAFREVVKI